MAKKTKTKPKYPGESRMLRGGSSWFYEQPNGLLIVTEVDFGGLTRAGTATIPWAKVEQAVKNHKAIRRARAR